jgi:hypothetical protein
MIESERAEHTALTTELRNSKAQLEHLTRLQRAAAAQRTNYYPSAAPVYAHHYRAYHYPYAQTYGAPTGSASTSQGYPYSVPLNSTITQYVPPVISSAKALSVPSTPTMTTSPSTPASSAQAPAPTTPAPMSTSIPVQLPLTSLPTLHALGIVPVPIQSLTAKSPTPPAVLRGTSANGAMLSLEINVSLLQAAQMSGLALVLNSIMRGSSSTASGEVPPHAQVGAPYTYPYAAVQPSATAVAETSSTSTTAEQKTAAAQPPEEEEKT